MSHIKPIKHKLNRIEELENQLSLLKEIIEDLGLDLKTTVKAVDELLKEEKLEVVNE
jgi:DNA-binding MarR family transcriptional regulator